MGLGRYLQGTLGFYIRNSHSGFGGCINPHFFGAGTPPLHAMTLNMITAIPFMHASTSFLRATAILE